MTQAVRSHQRRRVRRLLRGTFPPPAGRPVPAGFAALAGIPSAPGTFRVLCQCGRRWRTLRPDTVRRLAEYAGAWACDRCGLAWDVRPADLIRALIHARLTGQPAVSLPLSRD